MDNPKLPSLDEYNKRIERLQTNLREMRLDGAILFQRVDVCYFSGTAQNAALFIPPIGQPLLMAKQSFTRLQQEQFLGSLIRIRRTRDIADVLKKHDIRFEGSALGLELDVLPVLEFQKLKRSLKVQKFQDISPLILQLRMTKSPIEIDLMKQAAQIVRIGHERASEVLMTKGMGIREIELAAEVEAAMRYVGHEGIIHVRRWDQETFYGHVISGPNGALPSYVASPTGGKGISIVVPQGAGSRKIKKNEPVLVDIVGAFHGYYIDASRTYVIGNLPDPLPDAYECTSQILSQVIKYNCLGSPAKELYRLALDIVQEFGYEKGFMGCTEDRALFVGHGVGMELAEPPTLSGRNETLLQEGMTLAIEPKIAFPNVGVVGLEDTLHLTRTGLNSLTKWQHFLDIL